MEGVLGGMLPSVLIVDDEKNTREGLRAVLEEFCGVTIAASAEEAFNLMAVEDFDVVLTDLRMPGKSGLTVIDRALAMPNRPAVIMMTAYGSVDAAVQAMKRGATDFLTKPVNIERLEALVKKVLGERRLKAEGGKLKDASAPAARKVAAGEFSDFVGGSGKLAKVLERVKLVGPSKATVLIEGESGTGKELAAQAIHRASGRKNFVAVHCAALSESLLESELFGHEKGAFTGAVERRIGRFEAADGGTLFLDEIGEISASTQVKLLRFLETKTVERVGGTKPLPLDVRLVAATNRNLEALVREGTFREDLFFRLNVVAVRLPPLRERAEDVPLLLEHFVKIFAKENKVPPVKISAGAMRFLQAYAWPGNIRELRNFAENAVVLRRGGSLSEGDLEEKFRGGKTGGGLSGKAGGASMPNGGSLSVEENEKRLLREALEKCGGNRTRAAELLGISRRTLQRKLLEWPEISADFTGG